MLEAAATRTRIAVGLAVAFIVLNVLDILLTWQGLRAGAIELNFLMKNVLALGFASSVAFKLGVASGIAALMLYKGQFAMLIVGVSLLGFICVRNFMVIGQLSSL
jgi:hypothetical protein